MALTSDEQFTAQVENVVKDLAQLAENLSAEGLLLVAGRVLTARQTIRTIYTRLQQATMPTPTPADPSSEAGTTVAPNSPLAVTVEPPPAEPPP